MKIKQDTFTGKNTNTEKHQNPQNTHAALRTQEVFKVKADSTKQNHLKCSANLNKTNEDLIFQSNRYCSTPRARPQDAHHNNMGHGGEGAVSCHQRAKEHVISAECYQRLWRNPVEQITETAQGVCTFKGS